MIMNRQRRASITIIAMASDNFDDCDDYDDDDYDEDDDNY